MVDKKIETVKLDFSPCKLYGREKELSVLQDACERVRNEGLGSKPVHRLVTLQGSSGSGKTALAESLRNLNVIHQSGFFAAGKFDQSTAGTAAYGAFAAACTSLCHQIASNGDFEFIRNRVNEALGRGAANFRQFVPSLDKVIQGPLSSEIPRRHEWGFDQLKVQLREFLRALCRSTGPIESRRIVVLFLDDLQWADQGSLDLLRFLATDRLSRGLLLVASFRDDDTETKVSLEDQLGLIEKEMGITRIHVDELDKEAVCKLISGATDLSVNEIESFAEVVFRKTCGNVFFVLQFLRSIEEEGYLYFSGVTLRWEWDEAAIESETLLADNAVGFVAQKIQRLPPVSQKALKIAACLGSTIDTRIVDYIARNGNVAGLSGNDELKREKDWTTIFDSIAGEGLVNKRRRGSHSYMWSHDKVLEGAYSLLASDEDKEELHLQIGEALKRMEECPLGEQWKLIATTDQLNRGSSTINDESKRIELARMNLLSSKAVSSISAFYPAANYLKAGIALLAVETKWSSQYDLCLELHSSLAEIEKYLGHHTECKRVVDEVLEHALTLDDKWRSYMALIESLGAQGQLKQGIDIGIDLARRLGESLPLKPNNYSALVEVFLTKRALGRMTDDQLLNLPVAAADHTLRVFALFSRLRRLAWSGGQAHLATLLKARMMRLCVRHGINDYGGPVFAGYGSVLARIGHIDDAYRFGCLALKLCERFPIEESQTLTLVCVYLQMIKKPLSLSIEMLLRSHRVGMERGDVVSSFLSAVSYCVFYFYQGLPLAPIQEDALAFASLMRQYKNSVTETFVNFYRQLALNFMGRSDNFLILSGEALNLELVEQEAAQQKNHTTLLFSWTSQAVLACFSGDIELSTAMIRKLENVELLPEHFPGPAMIGLVSAFLARATKSKKYLRKTQKIIRQLDRVLKKGSVNYLHFHLLMKAELAVIQGKHDSAKKLFEAAMRSSAVAGFTNFEALANERAGIYALERDNGNSFWASTYLSRAVWLYSEWGAMAKVNILREKYPLLTTNVASQGPVSSNHQGRRRFDRTIAARHRGSWKTDSCISSSSLRVE